MAQQTEEHKDETKDDGNRRVNVICSGIGKYYRSYGWGYDALFSNFIYENEMGDEEEFDEIYEQDLDTLTGDPTEAQIIGFAEDNNQNYNFPFPKKQQLSKKKQAEHILKIIQQCDGNEDVVFHSNVSLPEFDDNFFDVKQDQFDTVRRKYKEQCPVLYYQGMDKDLLFCQMLAICNKAPCNYLQIVVDNYSRARFENFIQDEKKVNMEPKEWAKDHTHFKKLRQIKLPQNMPKFDDEVAQSPSAKQVKLENAGEFVEASVKLFGHRLCPPLSFKPIYLINDSIEIIIKYIYAGYKYVGNIVTEAQHIKRAALPMQFDLCVITKEATKPKKDEKKSQDNNEDGDVEEDDDDDDDEALKQMKQNADCEVGVDCVGDIKAKLKKNDCEYQLDKVDIKKKDMKETGRIFTALFNEIEIKHNPQKAAGTPYYLHKKRCIGFVDRRKEQKEDPVYMYLPPKGPYTRDIPEEAVPEWYVASSRTTILPNMEFNMEKAIGADDAEKDKNKKDTETEEEKLQKANIHSNSSCGGSLLILSFHIRSDEDMAVYLYYDGKMTRFVPDDLIDLLPLLFNPEYRENDEPSNAEYLKTVEIEDMMKDLNTIIKDVNFVTFRQSNTSSKSKKLLKNNTSSKPDV